MSFQRSDSKPTIRSAAGASGFSLDTGKTAPLQPYEHLFQHIKQSDPMLYEALKHIAGNFENVQQILTTTNNAIGFYQRTILIRDTTIGDDIADHVSIYGAVPGDATIYKAKVVKGVLRKAITTDLTLRIKNVYKGTSTVVGLFTIPLATEVDKVIKFTVFKSDALPDTSALTWDITGSDGSTDAQGVASFTLEWQ